MAFVDEEEEVVGKEVNQAPGTSPRLAAGLAPCRSISGTTKDSFPSLEWLQTLEWNGDM